MTDHTEQTMLGTEVLRLRDMVPVHRYDDAASEYSIRVAPESDSGIIIYGFYGKLNEYCEREDWYANPSLRPVVRELLKRLGIDLEAKT